MPLSCINVEDEMGDPEVSSNPSFTLYYQIECFPDYENAGIYALDPRSLYKNILYRYDIASNNWSTLGDHRGLPSSNRYNLLFGREYSLNLSSNPFIMEEIKAGAISKNSILYIKNRRANIFELETQFWNTHFVDDFYGEITINVFNPFNKTFYGMASDSLYLLNEDFSYSGITGLTFPLEEKLNASQFYCHDTLAIASWNLIEGKTDWTIRLINVKTKKIRTIQNEVVNNINPLILYFDKFREGKIYAVKNSKDLYKLGNIVIYCIDINKNQTIKLPTFFAVDLYENTFNRNKWAEITYIQNNTYRLIFIKDNIYLFWNEKGFLLNTAKKRWDPLPVLEFETFNSL